MLQSKSLVAVTPAMKMEIDKVFERLKNKLCEEDLKQNLKSGFRALDFYTVDQNAIKIFKTHLENFSKKEKSEIFVFYRNDGQKFCSKDINHNIQFNINKKRRRVFAYVWIPQYLLKLDNNSAPVSEYGYIFYAGCIFNPTGSPKSIPYDKKGELRTALSRLEIAPVVMTTTAKTHREVRNQISKAIFYLGVKGKTLDDARR
jgi:hypothetical protein